jgi:hypothetical protein
MQRLNLPELVVIAANPPGLAVIVVNLPGLAIAANPPGLAVIVVNLQGLAIAANPPGLAVIVVNLQGLAIAANPPGLAVTVVNLPELVVIAANPPGLAVIVVNLPGLAIMKLLHLPGLTRMGNLNRRHMRSLLAKVRPWIPQTIPTSLLPRRLLTIIPRRFLTTGLATLTLMLLKNQILVPNTTNMLPLIHPTRNLKVILGSTELHLEEIRAQYLSMGSSGESRVI